MKKFVLILFLFCLFSYAASFHGFAEGPLDEIQSITIDAQTSADGVVTLRYYIAWKVLDSDSGGPLSWVQIGVSNSSFYAVEACGGDAVTAHPDNSSGENKVRVVFKREFFKGETTVFHFTIRQNNLVRFVDGKNRCDFTPGGFEDIAVKNLTVKWNPDNVTGANTELGERDVWVWSGALEPGERFTTVTTFYSADMIVANPPETISTDDGQDEKDISTDDRQDKGDESVFTPGAIILFLIFFFIRVIMRIRRAWQNKYRDDPDF